MEYKLWALLLLIAALLWWRKKIDAKLSSLSEEIGHFRNDSQLHTPLALLLNLLLVVLLIKCA
mgnify:CR=1 FL=1